MTTQPSKCSCIWWENEDGAWETLCDEIFEFTNGSPTDNHFGYCPYCGQPLIEKKCVEPKEVDDS